MLTAATVALPEVDVGETVASPDAEEGLMVSVVPTTGTRSVDDDAEAEEEVTDPTLDPTAEVALLCAEASEKREAARRSFILQG